jgi:mycoredoxin-dependent peroxiredoxin
MKKLLVPICLWSLIVASGVVCWEGYKYFKHMASSHDFPANQPAPDFVVKDQEGRPFQLSSAHGDRVLLVFYRGHLCTSCMDELHEFAQHNAEFESAGVRVIAISGDTVEFSHDTWQGVMQKRFAVLSDPEGVAIRAYGLLERESGGVNCKRALVLVDDKGHERWIEPAGMMNAQSVLDRIGRTK